MKSFKQHLTEAKKVSAGLILTNGYVTLLCKVSFGKGWDIPKGEIDQGESPLQAVVREVREEVGISLPVKDLEDLGRHPYLKGEFAKDLHMFKYKTDMLPSVKTMQCQSTYIDKATGSIKPEVLGYKYVENDKLRSYLNANLFKVINKIP